MDPPKKFKNPKNKEKKLDYKSECDTCWAGPFKNSHLYTWEYWWNLKMCHQAAYQCFRENQISIGYIWKEDSLSIGYERKEKTWD